MICPEHWANDTSLNHGTRFRSLPWSFFSIPERYPNPIIFSLPLLTPCYCPSHFTLLFSFSVFEVLSLIRLRSQLVNKLALINRVKHGADGKGPIRKARVRCQTISQMSGDSNLFPKRAGSRMEKQMKHCTRSSSFLFSLGFSLLLCYSVVSSASFFRLSPVSLVSAVLFSPLVPFTLVFLSTFLLFLLFLNVTTRDEWLRISTISGNKLSNFIISVILRMEGCRVL